MIDARHRARTLHRGAPLLLATSRAPLTFGRDGARLRVDRGAGGVVTALRHLTRDRSLTWVAAAAGPDDRMVAEAQRERGGLIGSGDLTLRLTAMSKHLYADYHGEFCNRILWFVQHGLWSRRIDPEPPERIRSLAHRYAEASALFVEEIVTEMQRPGPEPVILTQDYQLYAVPTMLRERLGGAAIAHFVHVPWPSLDVWREALPDDVTAGLVRGILGAQVVGFQDAKSREHFATCVDELVGDAVVRQDAICWGGRRTLLRVRPVSVDPPMLRPNASHVEALRGLRAHGLMIIARVDRMDPIKNIPAGFTAFGRLLDRRPDLVGRVRFLARLVPSRSDLPEYAREWEAAQAEAEAVNTRFGAGTIEVSRRSDRGRALAELAAADVVLVNSVADGMNLVAKEAAFLNPRLALVLSRAAGAVEELGRGALTVDPGSVEETADALERGLELGEEERRSRAREMRGAVSAWTSRDWARAQMEDLAEASDRAASGAGEAGRLDAAARVNWPGVSTAEGRP